MKKIIFIIILFVMAILFYASISKNEEDVSDFRVSEIVLKGGEHTETLYIPNPDFNKMTGASTSGSSVLLNVMYPGMTPILENSQNLWKKGEWYRNISISINQYPKPRSIQDFFHDRKDSLRATKLIGTEYGLQHYAQEDDYHNQDKHDIWAGKEKGREFFFVTCSEKLSKTSVPQCSQYMRTSTLSIEFSYDKRLLQNHRKIKADIYQLLESYKTPETAAKHYVERLNKRKSSKKREIKK